MCSYNGVLFPQLKDKGRVHGEESVPCAGENEGRWEIVGGRVLEVYGLEIECWRWVEEMEQNMERGANLLEFP